MAGDITSHVLAGRQRQTHQEMIVGRTDGLVHAVEPEAEAICAIIIGATLDPHADRSTLITRVISFFLSVTVINACDSEVKMFQKLK